MQVTDTQLNPVQEEREGHYFLSYNTEDWGFRHSCIRVLT